MPRTASSPQGATAVITSLPRSSEYPHTHQCYQQTILNSISQIRRISHGCGQDNLPEFLPGGHCIQRCEWFILCGRYSQRQQVGARNAIHQGHNITADSDSGWSSTPSRGSVLGSLQVIKALESKHVPVPDSMQGRQGHKFPSSCVTSQMCLPGIDLYIYKFFFSGTRVIFQARQHATVGSVKEDG